MGNGYTFWIDVTYIEITYEMKDKILVVVICSIEQYETNQFLISGRKLATIEDAFETPFKSSKYDMYLSSKLSQFYLNKIVWVFVSYT